MILDGATPETQLRALIALPRQSTWIYEAYFEAEGEQGRGEIKKVEGEWESPPHYFRFESCTVSWHLIACLLHVYLKRI